MEFVQTSTSFASSTIQTTHACSAQKDIIILEAAALRLFVDQDNIHLLVFVLMSAPSAKHLILSSATVSPAFNFTSCKLTELAFKQSLDKLAHRRYLLLLPKTWIQLVRTVITKDREPVFKWILYAEHMTLFLVNVQRASMIPITSSLKVANVCWLALTVATGLTSPMETVFLLVISVSNLIIVMVNALVVEMDQLLIKRTVVYIAYHVVKDNTLVLMDHAPKWIKIVEILILKLVSAYLALPISSLMMEEFAVMLTTICSIQTALISIRKIAKIKDLSSTIVSNATMDTP